MVKNNYLYSILFFIVMSIFIISNENIYAEDYEIASYHEYSLSSDYINAFYPSVANYKIIMPAVLEYANDYDYFVIFPEDLRVYFFTVEDIVSPTFNASYTELLSSKALTVFNDKLWSADNWMPFTNNDKVVTNLSHVFYLLEGNTLEIIGENKNDILNYITPISYIQTNFVVFNSNIVYADYVFKIYNSFHELHHTFYYSKSNLGKDYYFNLEDLRLVDDFNIEEDNKIYIEITDSNNKLPVTYLEYTFDDYYNGDEPQYPEDYYVRYSTPNNYKDSTAIQPINTTIVYKLPITNINDEWTFKLINYNDGEITYHYVEEKTETYISGLFKASSYWFEGNNEFQVIALLNGVETEYTATVNLIGYSGFIDEDGDGLDDRGGFPAPPEEPVYDNDIFENAWSIAMSIWSTVKGTISSIGIIFTWLPPEIFGLIMLSLALGVILKIAGR